MATTITRQQRQATPARWRKAVERAIAENVQVRQLVGSGAWIATSGSDASAAYELEVTGDVAHGCNCLAGLNNDPCCKHRAAFYLAVGLLDPEPEPPAPALAPCGYCSGRGWETVIGKSGAAFRFDCRLCEGTGEVEEEESARPAPVAPAPLRCPGCAGTRSRQVRVVSRMVASGVVPIRCGRCRGTGADEPPAPAIAA
ncbi:MAG: hypothetical protein M3464_21795 [Chloroflexota bacterium]|nr:hypothetical protein [Chloroflexota bacterium]